MLHISTVTKDDKFFSSSHVQSLTESIDFLTKQQSACHISAVPSKKHSKGTGTELQVINRDYFVYLRFGQFIFKCAFLCYLTILSKWKPLFSEASDDSTPTSSSSGLVWKGARWQHWGRRVFISARPAAKLTYYPFPHTPALVKSAQLKLKVNAAIGLLIPNLTRRRKGVYVALDGL